MAFRILGDRNPGEPASHYHDAFGIHFLSSTFSSMIAARPNFARL